MRKRTTVVREGELWQKRPTTKSIKLRGGRTGGEGQKGPTRRSECSKLKAGHLVRTGQ